ncbi:fiber-1 [Pigeon adenovirus 1]|uniref:Fiber-1 n=1 Tax=Pigeon adenovirus 1 TaxID=764030 RepID=X5LU19_9ADEN|nr:fiber-1 [Pigeon adenovirus 1]CDO33911.1 fiber-1 [Pigeon adenovirus 1]
MAEPGDENGSSEAPQGELDLVYPFGYTGAASGGTGGGGGGTGQSLTATAPLVIDENDVLSLTFVPPISLADDGRLKLYIDPSSLVLTTHATAGFQSLTVAVQPPLIKTQGKGLEMRTDNSLHVVNYNNNLALSVQVAPSGGLTVTSEGLAISSGALATLLSQPPATTVAATQPESLGTRTVDSSTSVPPSQREEQEAVGDDRDEEDAPAVKRGRGGAEDEAGSAPQTPALRRSARRRTAASRAASA